MNTTLVIISSTMDATTVAFTELATPAGPPWVVRPLSQATITTIAAHSLALPSYDSELIHLARIHIDDVRAACVSLMQMPVADRRALPYMHPGRADVICAGGLICRRIAARVGLPLRVSETDILDGIILGLAA